MREIDDTPAKPSEPGTGTADATGAAELSRAAREAVRQSDPRIDRQLAKMGLADEDETVDAGSPARPVRASDLDGLREDVASARSEAASLGATVQALRGRVALLGGLVAIEGVALAVIAVVLLTR